MIVRTGQPVLLAFVWVFAFGCAAATQGAHEKQGLGLYAECIAAVEESGWVEALEGDPMGSRPIGLALGNLFEVDASTPVIPVLKRNTHALDVVLRLDPKLSGLSRSDDGLFVIALRFPKDTCEDENSCSASDSGKPWAVVGFHKEPGDVNFVRSCSAALSGVFDVEEGDDRLEGFEDVSDILSLAKLRIGGGDFEDANFLVGFPNLEAVSIGNSYRFGWDRFRDLTFVAGLPHLEVLAVEKQQVRDLSPLAHATGLRELALPGNSIDELTPLQGLAQLEKVDLSHNLIRSSFNRLQVFQNLLLLHELDLSHNEIGDASDLAPLLGRVDVKLAGNDKLNDALLADM